MIVTPTIRDLIIDNRVGEIRDYISDGHVQYGMQTFDQHLTQLVNDGEITFEVALGAATRPADFELNFRTLSRGQRAPTPLATPAITAAASAANVSARGAPPPHPLGTGPTLPPLATSPHGQPAVSSPSPFGGSDNTIFGSGFESLFGS
jgi:twitching motility protein PilT